MLVKTDFHLHTRYIGCADETMEVVDILRICQDAGLEEIAITDHLNHLGQLDQHWQIKEALFRCDESITVYFGAELNFSGPNGQLAIDDEAFENAIGFQFFIGGIHSAYGTDRTPLEILRTQQEHFLKICNHPQVSVLVHPFWFPRREYVAMPWLKDLSALPEEWIAELGETAVKTGTAIEINAEAIFDCPYYPESFKESYLEFLARLKEYGVRFSFGTDSHSIGQLASISTLQRVAKQLGITMEQIWRPEGLVDIRKVQ